MDLAVALAGKLGAKYLLISEPNVRSAKGRRWFTDNRSDAAIGYVGSVSGVSCSGAGDGFIWTRIDGISVYSCYISPNASLHVYENFLHSLARDLNKREDGKVLLTGDFNAKSPMWGSAVEDERGKMLGELLSSRRMIALNKDGIPTFVRGKSATTIDVTAVSEDLSPQIGDWEALLEEESLSPHRYIIFNLDSRTVTPHRWLRGPINSDRLREELVRLTEGLDDNSPERLVETLSKAYRKTTPRVRCENGTLPYWWTPEISELRTTAVAMRRRLTRSREAGPAEEAHENYRKAKKQLKTAILKSKKGCWRSLLEDLDRDVYGDGYKIVTKSLKSPYPPLELTDEERARQVDKLFPVSTAITWERVTVRQVPLFDMEELLIAADKLKPKKAPGLDGIPPEAVKIAVRSAGNYILSVMNLLLSQGRFPGMWKVSRLVLIEKPRKDRSQEKQYRPICLIDSLGKLYEQLINIRLEKEIQEAGGLSPNQHGFRKGHSTVEAALEMLEKAKKAHRGHPSQWCAAVLLDVKNAFNTANWSRIVNALQGKGISPYLTNVIKDYLSGRGIRWANGAPVRETNMGVPQGSILGPVLWNIMYDSLLRKRLPNGISIIGYADDVALVGQHKNWDSLVQIMNAALAQTNSWMEDNGLQLAAEKTEAITLKFGRRSRENGFLIRDQVVLPSAKVKYLGIMLDASVSFGPHIRMAANKAEASVKALSRLMPNVGGPSEQKRQVLGSVIKSILLYGAPIWADSMNVASYRRVLQSVQRKVNLRICAAYRTISYEAASVLSSQIPIHLMASERKRIWYSDLPKKEATKRERQRTLQMWQEEWAVGTKGAWTRRLIPDITPWVTRNHGNMGFHLTQALSGHGVFRTYTHKIGKARDDTCSFCGETDSPEHVVFECVRDTQRRNEMNATVGEEVSPTNIIRLMLASAQNWSKIAQTIGQIIRDKESVEREGQ